MPELPEVETTTNGLKKHVIGLTISDIWSNYGSKYFKDSETIKDVYYFKHFKDEVSGKKIISVERRAKNILINLNSGLTIIIHMKMTGHFLFGRYRFIPKDSKDPWEPIEPESLKDPYNRHVRLVFSFTNGKNLALSDVRRFAKVALVSTKDAHSSIHLSGLGPEPLDRSFDLSLFKQRICRSPKKKIKQVLTDQSVISGIGNIYADETLWRAGIHPAERVERIPPAKIKALFEAIKSTLAKGIDLGGDSMSDYRNVNGEKGAFQENHLAYRRTGEPCAKRGCKGTIRRMVLAGRSTHFCDAHQTLSP